MTLMSEILQKRFPDNTHLSRTISAFDRYSLTFDDGHKERYPGVFQGWRPSTLEECQEKYDRWVETVAKWDRMILDEVDREFTEEIEKRNIGNE